ncbi:MAG: YihY family inner membrane protein [Burkholderiaceae bacterium]|nr:YihY family inner membrane protein [Burkholderiaceae bacterium]
MLRERKINQVSKRFMRGITWPQLRNLFSFAHQRLREMRLPQVAGSLTFNTVLALVPILTIALAILTAFPLFATFKSSLEAYFIQSLMPKGISNTILGYLTQFATKATRLSAFGGLALFATAMATMAMIDRTFNGIWHVKHARPLMQRLMVYWVIVTLGPLLIGISISSTSFLFSVTTGIFTKMPFIGAALYSVISVVISTGAFTLLYVVVPNRLVDWRDAFWGALFAALAFELAKRLFSIFITQFPTYTVVYGALAAVPIFLLWIYLSWLIALFGAVIAAALPVVKFERWWHVPSPGSEFEDAVTILRILVLARHVSDQASVDVASIRAQTRFGLEEIEGLLETMNELGWVARVNPVAAEYRRHRWWRKVNGETERWILVMNPAALSLSDVYRVFVFNPVKETSLAGVVNQVIDEGLHQNLHDYFLPQAL